MLSFTKALEICLVKRYFNFKDRAQRSEYWWFLLFSIGFSYIANWLIGLSEIIAPDSIVFLLVICFACLYLVIPCLAVTVRRLHDINRSGWWLLAVFGIQLLSLIVTMMGVLTLGSVLAVLGVLGNVAILVFTLFRGTVGDNRYGSDPLQLNNPSGEDKNKLTV